MKIYSYLIPYRYILSSFFLIALSNFKIHAQELDSLIIWSKDYKLEWEDFLGIKSPLINKSGATSSLEIHPIKTSYKDEDFFYTVIPVFNRNKSVTQSFNDELLEHEQLHFDILELFARKIRQEFIILDKNNACDISYLEIFNKYSTKLWLYQKDYDSESNYSRKSKNQILWSEKISKELKKLEAFSIENLYGVKVEN